jgi:hypothetical protein
MYILGMRRRAIWQKLTDVSEERTTFIFTVEEGAKQEQARSKQFLLAEDCQNEGSTFSETPFTFYRTTRRHDPEDTTFVTCLCT